MDSSDKRFFIYKNILDFTPADDEESFCKNETLKLIEQCQNCFERNNLPGHVNGSALVVNEEFTHVLLTHHIELDKWFQFGGHAEGDPNILNVALREAVEESGMKSLHYYYPYTGISGLGYFEIPANEKIEKHYHADIIVLLVGDMNEPFVKSWESKELRWVTFDEALKLNTQQPFRRMIDRLKLVKSSKLN